MLLPTAVPVCLCALPCASDMVYATFQAVGAEHPVLGAVYVYAFVIMFTVIVLRVLLAGLQFFVFQEGEPHACAHVPARQAPARAFAIALALLRALLCLLALSSCLFAASCCASAFSGDGGPSQGLRGELWRQLSMVAT